MFDFNLLILNINATLGRVQGIIGILFILALAYLFSNNHKLINLRIILTGLLLQFAFAFFILKTSIGIAIFEKLGKIIVKYIEYPANIGAQFVFGFLTNKSTLANKIGSEYQFIFFFNLIATLIFISLLIQILYYFGIIQKIINLSARILVKILPINGVEMISNVASAIIGQVEAQIMIKPYLKSMHNSELLCSMTGSLSCISGSILVAYISLGIPPAYMMASSLMAIPGAIVISKIVFPSPLSSSYNPKIITDSNYNRPANILDAISIGCMDGLKVTLNLAAMLIGFMALITLIDLGLTSIHESLSIRTILSYIFTPLSWMLGVENQDIKQVSYLIGEKLVLNEFIAFVDLRKSLDLNSLSPKSIAIVTTTLCSFANFSSVGIQIGGISAIAPERRIDLAKLGLKALFCGSLTAYLSASIVGIIF